MNAPLPPRVVVAVSPELRREIEQERCDMLIMGLHFDESSAVAALERVLAGLDACPVVLVRGRRTIFGQRSLHALRMALDALGAQDYIDLLDYPDDASGNARVQAMLERLIGRACR